MPYRPGGEDQEPWVRAHSLRGGGTGVALCECGGTSPELDSDGARRRWHADHKQQVRTEGGPRG
jgi:hypothetical protein